MYVLVHVQAAKNKNIVTFISNAMVLKATNVIKDNYFHITKCLIS